MPCFRDSALCSAPTNRKGPFREWASIAKSSTSRVCLLACSLCKELGACLEDVSAAGINEGTRQTPARECRNQERANCRARVSPGRAPCDAYSHVLERWWPLHDGDLQGDARGRRQREILAQGLTVGQQLAHWDPTNGRVARRDLLDRWTGLLVDEGAQHGEHCRGKGEERGRRRE